MKTIGKIYQYQELTDYQYQQLRKFILNYISTLLTKPHITKKKELKETYIHLHHYGYLKNNYQCKFIYSFLRNDKKLTTTYSPELLSDLKRYKTSESHNTLERFFT
jgi:hypothetical protein